MEVAEFTKARDISDEPAFACCVPYTMRKRDVIVSALNSRIHKTTHNYGIEISTRIEHGNRLDKENSKNFWRDANATKMYNFGVALQVLTEGQKPPVGSSKFTRHLIWDMNVDFTPK